MDKIVLQNSEVCMKKKMKGTNEVGKNKKNSLISCLVRGVVELGI